MMVNAVTEDALERARQALALSPVFALRSLQVECHEGHLLLQGRVASFYHKQLAQEAVRAVTDGTQLVNTIEVAQSPQRLPR